MAARLVRQVYDSGVRGAKADVSEEDWDGDEESRAGTDIRAECVLRMVRVRVLCVRL